MSPFFESETWEQIHARLLQDDPVASSDLARACLEPLRNALQRRFPRCDPDLVQQAVHDAYLEIIRKPHLFNPQRGSLRGYLLRAAACDLANALRREARHHCRHISVELPAVAGNLLGREDEPSFSLCLAEARQQAEQRAARAGLSPQEARCWSLMQEGQYRNEVFAAVLGLEDLHPDEQIREVKRTKDRIKIRLKRAGEECDDCT